MQGSRKGKIRCSCWWSLLPVPLLLRASQDACHRSHSFLLGFLRVRFLNWISGYLVVFRATVLALRALESGHNGNSRQFVMSSTIIPNASFSFFLRFCLKRPLSLPLAATPSTLNLARTNLGPARQHVSRDGHAKLGAALPACL